MTGVSNGHPVLENGRVLNVANVIWCTGFTVDYDWIDLLAPRLATAFPFTIAASSSPVLASTSSGFLSSTR